MKSSFIVSLIVAFILFGACPVFVSAQPQGDEREVIHRKVNDLRAQISEIDGQLAEGKAARAKQAELHAERGHLNRGIYWLLYNGDFLSHFYGEKPPHLSPQSLTTKAIADFSQALKFSAAPMMAAAAAEIYRLRAEMYEARWKHFTQDFKWREERENLEGAEWRGFVEPHYRRNSRVVFEKFLENPDFQAALDDYEKVLQFRGIEQKTADLAHQEIARLYLERSLRSRQRLQFVREIPYVLPSFIHGQIYDRQMALAGQKNKYHYSDLGDIDRAIKHIEQSHPDHNYRQMYPVEESFFKPSMLTPMYANYFKAETADLYGKNDIALAAINEADKYFRQSTKNVSWDNADCQIYTLRSRLYLKAKNFRRALADAAYQQPGTPANGGGQLCYTAYVQSGDVYLEMGEFQKAVDEYNAMFSRGSGSINTESVLKKRGLAYLKAGETEKALKDFETVSGFWLTSLDGYLLAMHTYRQLGNKKRALDMEKAAINVRQNYELGALEPALYGRIRISDNLIKQPINYRNATLKLIYFDGTEDRWDPPVDEPGRFKIYAIKPKLFYLTAEYYAKIDGKIIKYFGRTERMKISGGFVGPLTINLKRVAYVVPSKDGD